MLNGCECHALNSLKDCLSMHVEVIVVLNMMDCITFSHITFPFIRPLKMRQNMTFILGCFMQYLVPFNVLFILFSHFNKPHVELLFRLYNSHLWYSVFRCTSICPLDFLWIRHLAASFTSLECALAAWPPLTTWRTCTCFDVCHTNAVYS